MGREMSRSGYSEDWDGENWDLIRYRGAVKSAFRGKRGQSFLREMVAAMDALPVHELAADSLQTVTGEVCALGAVGLARGMDMTAIDPDDTQAVADQFGIAKAMAAEIVYENDEGFYEPVSPAQRFQQMRSWLVRNIKTTT